jgi:hypothetical protein
MAVSDDKLDLAEIGREAFAAAMAGFGPLPWDLQTYWPGLPGRAYIFEMVRRRWGMAGAEFARTLPIFTLH